ncbi:MAG: tRNA 2-thiocytidine biosynthesis TtcA family protein [candidate division WOR-3 bacterium]|nr:tRNA 2-thiocytidine biosynthesis TtcA family protein [candidate division WOR-3 bacterium]
MKPAERLLRRALPPNQLLKENERVVIGVSGGADSLCLLLTLVNYNRRQQLNWQLLPVHIHPGFPEWKTERIEKICTRLGLSCIIKQIDVPQKLRQTHSESCFFCARERRKALFQTAAKLGCTKVALGHHLEDVNETFLLNLLFTASASTIIPVQPLFNGALTIIRPLYYFTEEMIRSRLKSAGIRPVRNQCPYQQKSHRLLVRRFLNRLSRQDHRIKTNLFWGIHNLKFQYLPSKSLVTSKRGADQNQHP